MKLLSPLTICMFFAASSLFAQSDVTMENGTTFDVVFTDAMNQKSLDILKQELDDRGVHVNYEDVVFGTEGQLESLGFVLKDMTDSVKHVPSTKLEEGILFGFGYVSDGKKAVVTRTGVLSTTPAKKSE